MCHGRLSSELKVLKVQRSPGSRLTPPISSSPSAPVRSRSPSLILLLHILARTATAKGAQDATVYGESRASPHAFYAHHAAAISAAVHEAFADQC